MRNQQRPTILTVDEHADVTGEIIGLIIDDTPGSRWSMHRLTSLLDKIGDLAQQLGYGEAEDIILDCVSELRHLTSQVE